jgi:DNA-directed RNA polymerase subunit RPC12/RpoP
MMKRFICKSCFGNSFSSSSIQNQKSLHCPYCGHEELVEIQPNVKIGELLCLLGILNEEKLRIALERQREIHEKIGKILILLNMISAKDLSKALSIQSQML